jgi:hypothetical protein
LVIACLCVYFFSACRSTCKENIFVDLLIACLWLFFQLVRPLSCGTVAAVSALSQT